MVSSSETVLICVFFLLDINPSNQISFSVLILVPLERIPRLLAEITLRTWFATFELHVIYHIAIGSYLFNYSSKSRSSTLS